MTMKQARESFHRWLPVVVLLLGWAWIGGGLKQQVATNTAGLSEAKAAYTAGLVEAKAAYTTGLVEAKATYAASLTEVKGTMAVERKAQADLLREVGRLSGAIDGLQRQTRALSDQIANLR